MCERERIHFREFGENYIWWLEKLSDKLKRLVLLKCGFYRSGPLKSLSSIVVRQNLTLEVSAYRTTEYGKVELNCSRSD